MSENHSERTEMPLKSLPTAPRPGLGSQDGDLNRCQSRPSTGVWALDSKGAGKAAEMNLKHKAGASECQYTNLHSR